jgi:recombination protein RecT
LKGVISLNNAVAQKPKFSVAIQTDGYKRLINNTLQDPKRSQRFIASISSAVAANPALQNCDAGTVLAGALLGESLGLSPSAQLGQYYLVPFEDRKNNRTVATFILGWRGYAQLAMRSGQYKSINVREVKKGELFGYDPFREIVELKPIKDPLEREIAETVGYYAFFEYLNGFRKELYWSKEKMIQHAERFSAAVKPNSKRASLRNYHAGNYNKNDEWMYSSFWYKDFDSMACKTMLRQLISKWGIMSIEMQSAFEGDGYSIKDGAPDYLSGNDIPELTGGMYSAANDADDSEENVHSDTHTESETLSMDDLG